MLNGEEELLIKRIENNAYNSTELNNILIRSKSKLLNKYSALNQCVLYTYN